MAYLRLFRPHQYVKNLFVFLPAFFAGRVGELPLLGSAALAFLAFCLVASSVYILNDLRDLEGDRKHPEKRNRPLAAGEVPVGDAQIIMGVCIALGMTLSAVLGPWVAALLGAYLVLNITYSLGLKRVPVLDVAMVAIGFVLRVFVGGVAVAVPVSAWLVVMTFLLALFIAMAKRRDDVLIYERTGEQVRKSVDGYNLQFLDGAMMVMAAVVIVAYISYTVSPEVTTRLGTDHLYFTGFFVIMGILRYLQVTFVEEASGSPTKVVLSDRFLQLVLLGWVLAFGWLLYRGGP